MALSQAQVGLIWLSGAISADVLSTFFSAKANGLEDKLSQGIAGFFYLASFVCCAIALKYIQAGILYVLWAGIGAIATAFLAQAILGQKLDLAAWIGMGFIIVGVTVIAQYSSIDI